MVQAARKLGQIYPWQEPTWQAWQPLVQQKRLHHALLYCAPAGSGELALLQRLSQALLCQHEGETPCHACHSCKLFAAGAHPDFHHVAPKEAGKSLGIDLIRECNEKVLQSSQLGGRRVILIEPCEQMGEAAANALLKTLEEPPSGCHFILLSHSLEAMLATVVSRCYVYKAPEPAPELVQQWLSNELGQEASLQSVRLCSGAPLLAKTFIEQQAPLHFELVQAFVTFAAQRQGLFTVTELMQKNEEQALNWLALLLIDAVKMQNGLTQEVAHCQSLALLQQLAHLPKGLLLAQWRALLLLKKKLTKQSGLNRELLLSEWLAQFHF
ncbi:MAG: DNA polymerase III subunit delta' [Vibrionaceae bacterium]